VTCNRCSVLSIGIFYIARKASPQALGNSEEVMEISSAKHPSSVTDLFPFQNHPSTEAGMNLVYTLWHLLVQLNFKKVTDVYIV